MPNPGCRFACPGLGNCWAFSPLWLTRRVFASLGLTRHVFASLRLTRRVLCCFGSRVVSYVASAHASHFYRFGSRIAFLYRFGSRNVCCVASAFPCCLLVCATSHGCMWVGCVVASHDNGLWGRRPHGERESGPMLTVWRAEDRLCFYKVFLLLSCTCRLLSFTCHRLPVRSMGLSCRFPSFSRRPSAPRRRYSWHLLRYPPKYRK